jgi:uncharacterized membrane protein YcgQ (UPF0703/DUF1980 family)
MKLLAGLLLVPFIFSTPPSEDTWNIFGRVKFTERLIKDEYFLVPFLDSRIKSYEGKVVSLKGYYLPMEFEDQQTIILSRHPYSMCFFCGGAGAESVAEVIFLSKRPKLKPDQIITVKGTLKLNATNVEHVNFILENAIIKMS